MTGPLHRHNAEKQTSCMSGIFQIFDRQHIHILSRKRIRSANRPANSTARFSPSVGASPETVSSGESQQQLHLTESEVEGEDDGCRHPSVVARLMGLGPLNSTYTIKAQQEFDTTPTLPRSGSERRGWKDPAHSRYIDGNNFLVKQPKQSHNHIENHIENVSVAAMKSENLRPESPSSQMHEKLEKRLKMRGMDEQFNDLTALKQILEVLQLRGLVHSANRSNRDSQRNFAFDPNSHSNESSIHLKQLRSLASRVDQHRSVNEQRKQLKQDDEAVNRSLRVPVRPATTSLNRIESNLKSCNSIKKTKPLSIAVEEICSRSPDSSTGSAVNSPRLTPMKTGPVQCPRNHKSKETSVVNYVKQNNIQTYVTEVETETSSVSEGIVEPASTDSEGSERACCNDGKRLLKRCEKLVHSVAEMSNTTDLPRSSAAVLPSPVSVLDSGFDKDESSSPSNSIDFKASPAVDFNEDNWTTKVSQTHHDTHEEHKEHEEYISDDPDFIYITKILRAPQHLQEKHLYNIENISHDSKVTKCHRKLVFDVINEMLDRNKQLPPWKTSIGDCRTSLKQIWCEFKNIREVVVKTGGDIGLVEVISGVLKKEVGVKDWDDYPIETSEVILDVERLIFKDLVSEAIRDLVVFSGECLLFGARRKLVF